MTAPARHSARASATLQALIEADPALAALSLWCAHRDDDTLGPPAETEGTEIRYGPGFSALAAHERIGLAGHHILHASLQHSARMADMALRLGDRFDPELWQIAADAVVNEAILAAGHALPRPALTLAGLLRQVGDASDPAQALSDWDCERLYHRLALSATGAGRAKSHAREQGFRPDLRAAGAQAAPSPDDTSGTGAEAEGRAEWRAHLARAMAAGRAAGFGLGVLGHRIADLPRPHTPWEIVLRRLLARATLPRLQPSTARPARSWLAQGARALQRGAPPPPWVPRIERSAQGARIVVALDASGSVGEDMLRLLMAEAGGIARRMQAALHLLVFDEALRIDRALDPTNATRVLLTLELPRGGGTDFAPVLARAADLVPSVLVILSDMDGPVGAERPRFPVIWAAPQPDPPAPPFGRVLSLAR